MLLKTPGPHNLPWPTLLSPWDTHCMWSHCRLRYCRELHDHYSTEWHQGAAVDHSLLVVVSRGGEVSYKLKHFWVVQGVVDEGWSCFGMMVPSNVFFINLSRIWGLLDLFWNSCEVCQELPKKKQFPLVFAVLSLFWPNFKSIKLGQSVWLCKAFGAT